MSETSAKCYDCDKDIVNPSRSQMGKILICERKGDQEYDVMAGKIRTNYEVKNTVEAYVCRTCCNAIKKAAMFAYLGVIGICALVALLCYFIVFAPGIILAGIFAVMALFMLSESGCSTEEANDSVIYNKYIQTHGEPIPSKGAYFLRREY